MRIYDSFLCNILLCHVELTLWQVHYAHTDPRDEVRHPIVPD